MSLLSRTASWASLGSPLRRACAALFCLGASVSAPATQIDIAGPPGSVAFGSRVLVLPNGNFVVADPGQWDTPSSAGAVHLYSANGSLISTLTGSDSTDSVGTWLMSLGNGNFIVISPSWNHGRGAVTFVNGTAGLSGAVSADNSLVGSHENDFIGMVFSDSVFEPPPVNFNRVVGNGNYVVVSNRWDDGNNADVGAVTWCNGTTGCKGPVTTANSLYGGTAGDSVGGGGVALLSNGNYVVGSGNWTGIAAGAGAFTWANGNSGITGLVSPANSLVGSHLGDSWDGNVVPLRNGNYVVAMPSWDHGTTTNVGAAVWGNGTTGITGVVSESNALYGSQTNDRVADSVTALSNGHYVVLSPYLDVATFPDLGAASWVDGTTGRTGVVSNFLSMIGPASGKGPRSAVALANGNYVLISPAWDAGGAPNLGAVTWLDGNVISWGSISATNSLIGSSANDSQYMSVVALSNGNYVVRRPNWDGVAQDTGAVTWANGSTGLVGTVSAANSLVGSTAFDQVGYGLLALSNGNYVALNPWWDSPAAMDVGAATWANGTTGLVGTISAANSLVGATQYDAVGGSWGTALSNGNYLLSSYTADVGGHTDNGAMTWGNGATGTVGTISTGNSLYGNADHDLVGSSGHFAMSDGNFVISSSSWNNQLGAITLGDGAAPLVGPIGAHNSVLGTAHNNFSMVFDYDPTRHRLVVGRSASNIVSLFTLDPDAIFASGFEQ